MRKPTGIMFNSRHGTQLHGGGGENAATRPQLPFLLAEKRWRQAETVSARQAGNRHVVGTATRTTAASRWQTGAAFARSQRRVGIVPIDVVVATLRCVTVVLQPRTVLFRTSARSRVGRRYARTKTFAQRRRRNQAPTRASRRHCRKTIQPHTVARAVSTVQPASCLSPPRA